MVDRIIGALLFVFFLSFLIAIPWQISSQGVPPKSPVSVFPQFFPAIMAIFGCMLSGVLVISTFMPSFTKDENMEIPSINNVLRILGVVAIMGFYIVFMTPLGFLISTMISLVSLMLIFGLREFRHYLTVTVILPVVVYIVFKKLLYVPLPVGLLGF